MRCGVLLDFITKHAREATLCNGMKRWPGRNQPSGHQALPAFAQATLGTVTSIPPASTILTLWCKGNSATRSSSAPPEQHSDKRPNRLAWNVRTVTTVSIHNPVAHLGTRQLHAFAGAAVTKYVNDRKWLSHGAGGVQCETKAWAGSLFLGAVGQGLFLASFPAFIWGARESQAFLGL